MITGVGLTTSPNHLLSATLFGVVANPPRERVDAFRVDDLRRVAPPLKRGHEHSDVHASDSEVGDRSQQRA
eukprot:14664340-Alexandrium_andersonii.AAC.1